MRACPPLIDFSAEIRREQQELKDFLLRNLYRHYRVNRAASQGAPHRARAVPGLSARSRACCRPSSRSSSSAMAPRAIADYVAGMTDRYAIREHRRLFAVEEG